MQKPLGRPLSSDWVSTSQAAYELGISRNHLLNLKTDGTFKLGRHCRDIRRTNSMRATYKWNLRPLIQYFLKEGEIR
ncbi:hypothetical protein [Microcoleus sp. B4-C1]|uniref:hypothetical protein n=1 Tax=Microcoleus sp. B4-C1 TaxID=2818660 RepID=UPI002FD58E88